MYGTLDIRLFPNKHLNVDLKNIEIWVPHGLNIINFNFSIEEHEIKINFIRLIII